jgi:hypothetical protein
MADQLVFEQLLADADEQHRTALDRHRAHVQTWFDELLESDKQLLAAFVATFEYETFVALAAAAGDYWHHCPRAMNAT